MWPLIVAGCLLTSVQAGAHGEDVAIDPVRTRVVSRSSEGLQGTAWSWEASMSADARFVAFSSAAANLVPDDTNELADIFVHDRDVDGNGIYDEPGAVETVRVSMSSAGEQAVRPEYVPRDWYPINRSPVISADGLHVAFVSDAPNLVPGDTNGVLRVPDGSDIFVHDRSTGRTERVSVATDGMQALGSSWAPAISAGGRFVAFISDAFNLADDVWRDVFVHDRVTGVTELVSVSSDGRPAHHPSQNPTVSADGRFIAFDSSAFNLVPDDTGGWRDVFVHDRMTGVTERVSKAFDGTNADRDSWGAVLSADGRYVGFSSAASNVTSSTTGRSTYVPSQVYLHDRMSGDVRMVSVSSEGEPANGMTLLRDLSADARFVLMVSYATDLTAEACTVTAGTFAVPSLYLHDLVSGQTRCIARGPANLPSLGTHWGGSVSDDGRHVAFESDSPVLAPGDVNGTWDVFVRSVGRGVCAPGFGCHHLP